MGIEEKAKAYEMALEGARKELGVDRKEWEVVRQVLHNIFPELRESEDERIRKEMIKAISEIEPDKTYLRLSQEEKDAWIAYLEKQQEQKPEDTVPVRFEEEDGEKYPVVDYKLMGQKPAEWSEEDERVRKALVWHLKADVDFVSNGVTKAECIAYLEKQKGKMTAEEFESSELFQLKLKTKYANGYQDALVQKEQKPADDKAFEEWLDNWYQDAKDTEGRIIMTKWEFKNWSRGIRNMYEQKPVKWTDLTWKDIVELEGIINNVHYEFRNGIGQESFGKEVLERFREYKGDEYLDEIEQKPVEYLDKDKVYAIMKKLLKLSAFSQLIPINSEEYKMIDEITCDVHKLLDYPIEQKPADLPAGFYVTFPDGKKYYTKEMRCNNMKVKVVEPKPAEWSEEDESELTAVIYCVSRAIKASKDENERNSLLNAKNWLQDKLSFRVQSLRPQPIQLKEAYKDGFQTARHAMALAFMNYLDENRPKGKMSLSNGECEDIDKAFKEGDWAKIMRYYEKYHPSWKPSEEQMEAFESAMKLYKDTHFEIHHKKIVSLYEQLKKLM